MKLRDTLIIICVLLWFVIIYLIVETINLSQSYAASDLFMAIIYLIMSGILVNINWDLSKRIIKTYIK